MDGLEFDLSSILTAEESEELYNEGVAGNAAEEGHEENEHVTAEGEDGAEEVDESPEGVGDGHEENNRDTGDADFTGESGTSPKVLYSSIARALKEDGIFPDLEDKDLEVEDNEGFGQLFEKAVQSKVDERTRRVNELLNNNVAPDVIRGYEQTISYLENIDDDSLEAEGDEGEALRRYIIGNDLKNKGYSEEKIEKELKKSFDSGSDIEDAKDALNELKRFYNAGYKKVQDDAKKQRQEQDARNKKTAEDFKKMVIDNDVVLGDLSIDKNTRQKIYDAVTKPVFKDPDTGALLTAVQKFQKENPLEFLKQLGMWFVLTENGKNMTGFTKGKVKAEKYKAIKDLQHKLSAQNLNPDGSIRFIGGGDEGNGDVLLSDDWKIG